MWEKGLKKTIYTLAINNWEPNICDITFPLLKRYAAKIGADFVVIGSRNFPDWPITYEKFQIYELGQEDENDWNIYIDADALVHPETPDFTYYLNKDTVAHVGVDKATLRWKFDRFFLRDGRDISSCNWFSMASDWCIDFWHPADDLSPKETIARCFPTVEEELTQMVTSYHLIDDFLMSRNIAKFGLKFKCLSDIIAEKFPQSWFFWHQYTIPTEVKIAEMKSVIEKWKVA
jgi:hypothetical protein